MPTRLSDDRISELPPQSWPALLRHIPDPPERLDIVGEPPPAGGTYLTVIGSRNPSDYGRACVKQLIEGLAGYPISIVSGLALGIDGLAHEAALAAGLKTVSFPGSGLARDALYPVEHHRLAERIVAAGGCLISEFARRQEGTHWTFPRRNRLMAGCSQATLIIEGRDQSGSLITTRLALDYGRSVLAVPGPIDSLLSVGPNGLLRRPAAGAVTSSLDILEELGIVPREPADPIPPERLASLDLDSRRIVIRLENGPVGKDELSRELGLPMADLNPLISFLEIDGLVRTSGNVVKRAK